MLAQRFQNAQVMAIELDSNSSQQSAENFQNSPWSTRLSVEHVSLQNFHPSTTFDLIVSNPPYFENNLKANDRQRRQARHTDTLLKHLLNVAQKLLSDTGSLANILPSISKEKSRANSSKASLIPKSIVLGKKEQQKLPLKEL